MPGRVSRLDRGWSTVLRGRDADLPANVRRVRNIGADVAVGDWVVPSDDGERVEAVLPRRSAFVRRASFEGARADRPTRWPPTSTSSSSPTRSGSPPNQRRLERELVLAYDSGADPVVVLTKADLVDDPEPARRELQQVALVRAGAADQRRTAATASTTCGPSPPAGARWRSSAPAAPASRRSSTPCSARACRPPPRCAPATSGAATPPSPPSCCALPGEGWLVDTPGVRAMSLWLSGEGIERAFADVFELMEHCRFRDCKHDQEPGCAVREAIEEGRLDPDRFASLERLVAEEAALEEEQRAKVKAGRPPPRRPPDHHGPGVRRRRVGRGRRGRASPDDEDVDEDDEFSGA